MGAAMGTLQSLYYKLTNASVLKVHLGVQNESIEPNFIQISKYFADCHHRMLRAEQELGSCKENLTKTETENQALKVKLKHSQNQVDVEIQRRQKAEADCEKLDRQIQLIREQPTIERPSNEGSSIEGSSIEQTSSEQPSIEGSSIEQTSSEQPSIEGSSIEQTSSEQPSIEGSSIEGSSIEGSSSEGSSSEGSSSIRLSAELHSSLAFPNTNNQAASNLKPSFKVQTKDESTFILSDISNDKTDNSLDWDASTSRTDGLRKNVKCVRSECAKPEDEFKQPSLPQGERKTLPSTPKNNGGVRLHEFVSKTGVLFDYVPETSSMIPSLVVHCVREIEQRGLHEPGLYSVSCIESRVKELKERFLRGKTLPVLSKRDDIHTVTGLLKNYLRNLKEPLLTARLHQSFMDLAEDDNSIALMYQTIGDLPQPNRETLAFLMLHLQRVANSEETRMNIKNLSLVFGPPIVGHAVQNPEPSIILKDTKKQFKVVARLLSLPGDYWAQFVMAENGQPNLDHRSSRT